MANVLQASIGGAKKTRIMYSCNLNFKQLQTYMDLLVDRKLLRIKSEEGSVNKDFYETTGKGLTFLRSYQRIENLLGSEF